MAIVHKAMRNTVNSNNINERASVLLHLLHGDVRTRLAAANPAKITADEHLSATVILSLQGPYNIHNASSTDEQTHFAGSPFLIRSIDLFSESMYLGKLSFVCKFFCTKLLTYICQICICVSVAIQKSHARR